MAVLSGSPAATCPSLITMPIQINQQVQYGAELKHATLELRQVIELRGDAVDTCANAVDVLPSANPIHGRLENLKCLVGTDVSSLAPRRRVAPVQRRVESPFAFKKRKPNCEDIVGKLTPEERLVQLAVHLLLRIGVVLNVGRLPDVNISGPAPHTIQGPCVLPLVCPQHHASVIF